MPPCRGLGVTNAFDPAGIDAGTHYLAKMLDLFGGDTRLALAGYNAVRTASSVGQFRTSTKRRRTLSA